MLVAGSIRIKMMFEVWSCLITIPNVVPHGSSMAQHWPLGHLVPAKTHDRRRKMVLKIGDPQKNAKRQSQVQSIPCGAEKPPKITQVFWRNVSRIFLARTCAVTRKVGHRKRPWESLGGSETGAANRSNWWPTKSWEMRDCPDYGNFNYNYGIWL